MLAVWWWTFIGHNASPNDWYNFTSGPIVVLSVFTVAWATYKARQCHSKHCWRWGHYPTKGGLYRLCRICHPDVPDAGPTRDHVRAHHQSLSAEQEREP